MLGMYYDFKYYSHYSYKKNQVLYRNVTNNNKMIVLRKKIFLI